jgi:phosphatidylinositol kinase/protein kinase (PI-3  family)
LQTTQLISFIFKSNDDLRQEEFAMQMVTLFADMFAAARTRLWLRPYQVPRRGVVLGLMYT